MSQPRITVLIPSRDRCGTLGAAIKSCVDQDYDNLDIVVVDNVSQDDTEGVIRSFSDPRLRHVKPDRRLSMTSNFEFALAQATPGMVVAIGDDDALMPGAAARVAELVSQSGLQAVASPCVNYGWPNFQSERDRNRLYIPGLGRNVEVRDARAEAARVASLRGNVGGYVWSLPSVYRGFIAFEVIEAARRGGRYFHAMTPDAYSAFANCFVLEKFLFSERPLTVSGTSASSNGASQFLGIDKSEEKRFIQEADLTFHPDVAYAPATALILADSYWQARAHFPEICRDHDFGFDRVCAAALRDAKGPKRERVLAAVREMQQKHGITRLPSTLPVAIAETWNRFVMAWKTIEVDCSVFGIRDVYRASLLAHDLLVLAQEGKPVTGINAIWSKLARRLGKRAG